MLKIEHENLREYEKCAEVLPLKLKFCLNLILLKIEQVMWRHGRLKCKSKRKMSLWHEHVSRTTSNMYQNSTKNWQISLISLEISYLCQRLWTHILTSVLTQLNMNLDSEKNLALLNSIVQNKLTLTIKNGYPRGN